MKRLQTLSELCEHGRMHWVEDEHAWSAEPDAVMDALASDGFQEYKREVARSRRTRTTGGVWQGVHGGTGVVASAIWVSRPRTGASALVFIDIDGEPLEG